MMGKMFAPLAAMALWLAGCGGGSGTSEARKAETPAASAPVDTRSFGSISGKVVFAGQKPEPRTISMDAQPVCARMHSGPIYSEEVIVNSNGTLKNVLVRIKEGLPKQGWPVPAMPVKLDQKACVYRPHVLGVQVNQTLEIHNSDDTNHNVHPLPRVNREWNESQPPKGLKGCSAGRVHNRSLARETWDPGTEAEAGAEAAAGGGLHV